MKHPLRNALDFEPRWIVVIVFFIAGIFFGSLSLYVWTSRSAGSREVTKLHLSETTYKFINPLIAIDFGKRAFFENRILESVLKRSIAEATTGGSIKAARAYVHDLEHAGHWSGVGEDEEFFVAKPLRLMLLIAYYKEAQEDASVLDETLPVSGTVSVPGSASVSGEVSIQTLLERMIVQNDNDALAALYERIDKGALASVYSDFGINYEQGNEHQSPITIKQYAVLFRALYNATYLSHDYSEQALELVSRTPTDHGISGEVPREVVITHLYQTRDFSGERGLWKHVYDCGIIYVPENPTIVCVSAYGKELESVDNFLRSFGQTVYNTIVDATRLQ